MTPTARWWCAWCGRAFTAPGPLCKFCHQERHVSPLPPNDGSR